MYTVLWQEAGADRWDRFESKEEVLKLLKRLEKDEDVCEGDVYIFTPEADDFALDYDCFVNCEE